MLEKLVTKDEMDQLNAFPTLLRMCKGTDFLTDLYTRTMARKTFKAIKMERLIDGKEIQLTEKQLWEHLNLHLIHALDFLQPLGWSAMQNDFFLDEVCTYFALLKHSKK